MTTLTDARAAQASTRLTEEPTLYGEHIYTARRNEGELRYQVFRDGDLAPVGYIDAHRCTYHGNAWRLRVYGADLAPIGQPSRHGADHAGCVHSYTNALSHLRAVDLRDDPECPDTCPVCGVDLASDGYPIGHKTDEGEDCSFRWVRMG